MPGSLRVRSTSPWLRSWPWIVRGTGSLSRSGTSRPISGRMTTPERSTKLRCLRSVSSTRRQVEMASMSDKEFLAKRHDIRDAKAEVKRVYKERHTLEEQLAEMDREVASCELYVHELEQELLAGV